MTLRGNVAPRRAIRFDQTFKEMLIR